MSDEIDPNPGQPVINMIRQKHLTPIFPVGKVPEHYNVVPEFAPFDVTKDTAKAISRKLTSAAGLGRIDAAGLQQLLLDFGISR